MKGRSILKSTLFILNLIGVAALICSYLAGIISPEKSWFLAFFGLAYPVFLILNLVFVVIWLLAWKKWVFISLVALLAGIPSMRAIFPVRFSTPESPARGGIRIVSFNVHSLYGNKQPDGKHKTKSKVTEFLTKQDADLICIQEFFAFGEDFAQTLTTFANSIHLYYYSFRNYREFPNQRKINAIATFSRYPIVNEGYFRLPGRSHYAIFSDLVIGNDTVRVYNLHLESIRFGHEDYSFYSNLTEPDAEESADLREGSKRMLWKLRKAFVLRSRQVDNLTRSIAGCRYPVILAGDFNDTPSSYSYHQLTNKLSDSFVESGHGLFQNTYAGKLPSFRIDYILHSKTFRSSGYKSFNVDLSDHYPITTILTKTH